MQCYGHSERGSPKFSDLGVTSVSHVSSMISPIIFRELIRHFQIVLSQLDGWSCHGSSTS